MQTKYNAYLTVYLSLIFGIVLSLLFVLIEGAATGAIRAQAELVADLGIDSVFAEYNRELLEQYRLFFIDSSYGGKNGGTGMVEKQLSDYLSYNMNPEEDLLLFGEHTLLKIRNPYLEISEVSYASDEHCMVWKAQAVHYMKAVYGGDLLSKIQEHVDIIKSNHFIEKDVYNEIAAKKQEFEEALEQKEIQEFGAESEEGYSYQKVSGLFDTLAGSGLLRLVLPTGHSVSGAVMDAGPYFSARKKNGKINQGVGLQKDADKPEKLMDELIFGEYLLKLYGCYTQPKEKGLLKYQNEYILYGFNSDAANLRRSVEVLFALRAAANLSSLYADSVRKSEVDFVALIICSLLLSPELSDILSAIILGIWALAEAVSDVRQLLDGGRISLIKEHKEWNTSLTGILTGNFHGDSTYNKGLSYQDYLRVFLALMNKEKKITRSLDIVEMDLRQTNGNEHFRIDRCIDYIKVHFGFEDANGHDFVFYKKMCYE